MIEKRKKHTHNKQNFLIYLVISFVLLYGALLLSRGVKNSVFLTKQDRINIVFYGAESRLLSFGLTDDVNYIVTFSNEHQVSVPGGYGRYGIGSLGRLAEVEKDQDIIKRTFSSMSSSYVNFFVLPKSNEVYEDLEKEIPSFSRRALIRTLFSPKNRTNMNIFNKIYVAFQIARKRQQDFVVLRSSVVAVEGDERLHYSEHSFLKKYKGFFYHQSLREEAREVQIQYNTYKSATTISRVIEGLGVRVVDLSLYDGQIFPETCIVRHNLEEESQTVRYLARQFDCTIEKGITEGVDIVFVLGKKLEMEWE